MKFKIGDKVKCTNLPIYSTDETIMDYHPRFLKLHKIYEVIDSNFHHFRIINEQGNKWWLEHKYFISANKKNYPKVSV